MLHKVPQAIRWPAFIQFSGQAELSYLANESAWVAEAHQHLQTYQPGDRVVDSVGQLFALKGSGHTAELSPTGEKLTLPELLPIVRAHAAQAGLCCTAKLSAASIGEAVQLLSTLHED